MNELPQENNYVNLSLFQRIAAPVLALALAALFWAVFLSGGYGPGLGVPVFVACYFGAVLLLLGRRARYTGESIFLLCVSMALAISCWLYSVPGLTIFNCFVILATAAGSTFLLSGQNLRPLGSLRFFPAAAGLALRALFTNIPAVFQPLKTLSGRKSAVRGQVLLSILLCVPLLAIVLALLSSADAVFASFFDALRVWLEKLSSGELIWKLCRTVALALLFASALLYLLAVPAREPAPPKARARHAVTFLLPAVLLDAVYILFCAVQLKYLFGGAEAAAMAGGWAHYAREGFFQLAAVAVINLSLCALGAHRERLAGRGGAALRVALGLLLGLTLVILLSAARRMQLYILAYGLSTLRLMTLWGMAVILAGIGLAGWKLWRPGAAALRIFIPFVLTFWCLFSLAGPGPVQANYNVNHYLSGSLAEMDAMYLASLGTDALPALYRLEEAKPDQAHFAIAVARVRQTADSLYGDNLWAAAKLSYRHLER